MGRKRLLRKTRKMRRNFMIPLYCLAGPALNIFASVLSVLLCTDYTLMLLYGSEIEGLVSINVTMNPICGFS